jgi:hypothetical protein
MDRSLRATVLFLKRVVAGSLSMSRQAPFVHTMSLRMLSTLRIYLRAAKAGFYGLAAATTR